MQMPSGGSMSGTLSPAGVDFSNETQAFNFMQEILDDSVFQPQSILYSVYFWYGTVVVIAIASLINISQAAIARGRLRAAASNQDRPSTPRSRLLRLLATATAIGRELSYPQFRPSHLPGWIQVPPAGTILLLIIYLVFVLALEFNDNFVAGAQHYTALGVRAGWLACAQLPLLILLIGKNNLIGLLTGVGYERLSVLHRWVSRVMLLMATLHFGYQAFGWNQYGLLQLEWNTDTCPPTGIAAYAILLWLNLSTLAPFRHMAYEFFVVQHIVSFFGFIIALAIHLPATYARVYLYIPSALYLVDRLVRAARLAYNNRRLARASLEAKEGGVTKIRVRNHQIKSWHAGSHVLLSLPRLGFGQNHPTTIASTPTSHDGDLVFILKSKKGFTNSLLRSSTSSTTALRSAVENEAQTVEVSMPAVIDGPYPLLPGRDFAAFDSLVLIACGTGITFTVSQFTSIAQRALAQKLPLRRVDFVWVVRNRSWTTWLDDELATAYAMLERAGIQTSVKIFVTCDGELLSDAEDDSPKLGCGCASSAEGKCCCSNTDAISVTDPEEEKSESVEPDGGKDNALPGALEKLASCSSFCSGRPIMGELINEVARESLGEIAVAVCGTSGLNQSVRNTVVRTSDERAVHKGTDAQGIFLHVEAFSG